MDSFRIMCPYSQYPIELRYIDDIFVTKKGIDYETQDYVTQIQLWSAQSQLSDNKGFQHICIKKVPATSKSRLLSEAYWLCMCSTLFPSIVNIFGMVEFDSHSALMMEYLPAGDVFDWLPRDFPKSLSTWVESGIKALQQLGYVGIAHNDISLENLSCRLDTGDCVLMDFEHTSFISHHFCLIPTKPRYRAPEALDIKEFNAANKHLCDMFAFGVSCSCIILRETDKSSKVWYTLDSKKNVPCMIANLMCAVHHHSDAHMSNRIIPLLSMLPHKRTSHL